MVYCDLQKLIENSFYKNNCKFDVFVDIIIQLLWQSIGYLTLKYGPIRAGCLNLINSIIKSVISIYFQILSKSMIQIYLTKVNFYQKVWNIVLINVDIDWLWNLTKHWTEQNLTWYQSVLIIWNMRRNYFKHNLILIKKCVEKYLYWIVCLTLRYKNKIEFALNRELKFVSIMLRLYL